MEAIVFEYNFLYSLTGFVKQKFKYGKKIAPVSQTIFFSVPSSIIFTKYSGF